MKLFVALMLLFCVSAPAQKKIKVHIDCTCNDTVGQLYATALRDTIAVSPRFQLAPTDELDSTGKLTIHNWTLNVVTLDDGTPDSRGYSTAIAIVLTLNSTFFTQRIQTCGKSVVSDCAAGTIAALDNEIEQITGQTQ